jgi:hypothetical protein
MKAVSKLTGFFLVLATLNLFASHRFPLKPDSEMTPGSVCEKPNSYRYPERIRYCRRNVSQDLKQAIIEDYDSLLGYEVGQIDRRKIKIDHYIPLCAGGSNERDNLWPQTEDVYLITDPVEPLVCKKMEKGVLSQSAAIVYIKRAKNDHGEVENVLKELEAL